MDLDFLAAELGEPASSISGAAKKRKRDGLPRVFLIYELDECCISGAFLAEDCFLQSVDCVDVFLASFASCCFEGASSSFTKAQAPFRMLCDG